MFGSGTLVLVAAVPGAVASETPVLEAVSSTELASVVP